MRAVSDQNAKIIKSATASAYDAVGGVCRAADALGVRSSTLTKYASEGDEWRDSFIRLDLAVALDRQTDHPFLLTAMNRLVRGEAVAAFGEVTASAILRLDRILGDVVREVARALEDDGSFDAAERKAVRQRINAAKRDLARLDAFMAGTCETGCGEVSV